MRLLPLLLVVALLVGCDSGGDSKPSPEPAPPRAITEAELGEHLSALQEIANGSDGTARKRLNAVGEFHTDIENHQGFIPNSVEHYRHGERISTGFVESTVTRS